MRAWGPLTAVCLGTFMLLLDVTIAVVALPDMARGLDASLSDLQWVMDGYALALAALLLGAGAAADVLGRRRTHVAGVALFAVASLLCGLAAGPGMLVAARALQGVGAAAMFATTLPLLGSVYQGRRRSVALGVWGAVSGVAAAVGPVLGGLLTDGPGWRWIFWVNLPVSVVAVWLTLRVVPELRGAAGRRVDWPGTAAFAAFAGTVTYGAVRAGSHGWTEAGTVASFAGAVLALGAFVAVERRSADPLLDPRLFARPAFSAVMLGALAFNAGAFALLAYTSIWLQTLLGMSPVRGGLVFLWLSLASFAVAAAGGRLLHGVPARFTIGGGLLLIGVGQFCMASLDASSTASALVPGLLLVGVGTGLAAPGIAGAALAAVPPERAGMAGGAVNTFRQLGYGARHRGLRHGADLVDGGPAAARRGPRARGRRRRGALRGDLPGAGAARGLRLRAERGGGDRRGGGRARRGAGAGTGQERARGPRGTVTETAAPTLDEERATTRDRPPYRR
ncbi:MFS transporter OS=Streptomyces fumanus OX=67302 GN=GCM10018772_58770 PE=4 SV=1 [Streptomyces fumanus]